MKHIQTVRRRKQHSVHNSTSKNEKTILPSGIKLSGSIVSKNEGWTIINIYGDPFERGFAHGYLLKNDLERVTYLLPFLVKKTLKVGMATYLETLFLNFLWNCKVFVQAPCQKVLKLILNF